MDGDEVVLPTRRGFDSSREVLLFAFLVMKFK